MPRRAGKQRKVLIVGDWAIDENWVVAAHNSETSTPIVPVHFRAVGHRTIDVFGLCGAGRVGRALYWMNRYTSPKSSRGPTFQITGLGLWDKDDTPYLASLFQPDSTRGHNPYTLRAPVDVPRTSSDIRLYNLDKTKETEFPHNTTRVYRFYQPMVGGVRLIQRIDWEQPARIGEDGVACWDLKASLVKRLLAKIKNERGPFDAIIVKDLGKGVVSRTLVEELAGQFRKIPWFVSTKLPYAHRGGGLGPEWQAALAKVPLRLLVLPSIALKQLHSVPRWIAGDGRHLAREARDHLELLRGDLFQKKRPYAIVAMPCGLQAVAFVHEGLDRDYAIVNPVAEGVSFPERVGRASVFFATLIANMLVHPELKADTFSTHLGVAIEKSEEWRLSQEERLTKRKDEAGRPKETDYGTDLLKAGASSDWGLRRFPWETTKTEWDESQRDLGIVTVRGRREFHLWRGMSDIDGYVACVPALRAEVARLVRMVRGFTEERPRARRNISTLLLAKPGAGKSFLVKALARHFGITFLEFNITQLLSRQDLIDCFDEIATMQAKMRSDPVLVFFDEINAELQRSPVFDLFLAPLEDGVYRRGGKRFHIDPSIWIFATTSRPATTKPAEKASDFLSRMTHDEIDLTTHLTAEAPETTRLAHLEHVYMGVAMLKDMYPDIETISVGVLKALFALKAEVRVRELRRFVQRIHNVRYACVTMRNLPSDWKEEMVQHSSDSGAHSNTPVVDPMEFLTSPLPADDEPVKIVFAGPYRAASSLNEVEVR